MIMKLINKRMINLENIKNNFKELTGYNPYAYQLDLCEAVLQGKNVLLCAPTGAGKTMAALLPFIYSFHNNISFPKKLIYSVPLRTLGNSLYDSTSKGLREYYEKNPVNDDNKIITSIQTGESPDDPEFLSDIVFTTYDQSLSGFLNIPVGLSDKKANMLSGAIASSYLIFDEIHLYDFDKAFKTLNFLMKELEGIAPFCIMSATLTKEIKKKIEERYKETLEIIDLSNPKYTQDLKQIEGNRKKFCHIEEKVLDVESVFSKHKQKTIVIFNTVKDAQAFYKELINKKPENTEIILIHSRFTQEDRREKEKRIIDAFNEDEDKKANIILVATQVIEVGIDISADTMHTVCCPANSLIQRIGRCARRNSETGNIYVYYPFMDEDKDRKYLPYEDKNSEGIYLSQATYDYFRENLDINLDFQESQKLITRIHAEKDNKSWKSIDRSDYLSTMTAHNKVARGKYGEFIREVEARLSFIIYDNTDKLEKYKINPYELERFSISLRHFKRWFNNLTKNNLEFKNPNNQKWLIKKIDELESSGFDYKYQFLDIDKVPYDLFIVNSKYAKYDKETGLELLEEENPENNYISQQIEQITSDKKNYEYTFDSFNEHTSWALEAYQTQRKFIKSESRKFFGYRDSLEYIFPKLEAKFSLPENLIDELIKIAIIFHDLGKLDKSWQEWAHEVQDAAENPKPFEESIAHTDTNDKTKEKIKKIKRKRPSHAMEAGYAIGNYVHALLTSKYSLSEAQFKQIILSVSHAIGRHHQAFHEGNIDKYELDLSRINREYRKFADILTLQKFELIRLTPRKTLISSQYPEEMPILIYGIIVRILRLCDIESFYIKN